MKSIVVGTAGHIDHGKTTLVRALTGIDTDRLEEEKRRGISIDLGFAHCSLGGNRIAFVDVPGHERFIKNMLAGAGGIDAVVLVVSAEESIKPQTREHFDICRLLDVRRGLVAVTKSDLVDPELIELVRLEIAEFLADSFLADAPIIPVSATTGAGLDDIRAQLQQLAIDSPGRDSTGFFRMPVDRAFAMKGFGAVATGTVRTGTVKVEQEVEVYPIAKRVRVRNIHVHGEPETSAQAGQRAALNLTGIELEHLARGMTIADPDRFRPTTIVDCSVELLPYAKPLRHGAPVHFHSGTAEVEAEVRVLGGANTVENGETGYIRLKLSDAILAAPGDRFIVRMFSPVTTIGGGTVIDPQPPLRIRRVQAGERAKALHHANLADRITLLLKESAAGIDYRELSIRTGQEPPAHAAYERIGDWFVDRESTNELLRRLEQTLKAFHATNPLLPGLPKEEVRQRFFPSMPAGAFESLLMKNKPVVVEGVYVRLSSHTIRLASDESDALSRIETAFEKAGLAVPSVDEALQSSGVELKRAKSLLQILLRDRKLIRVGDGLVFHSSALGSLRSLLTERKGQRFSVSDFKEWTGVSRKYAIPLLEFLDRERLTRREGDTRIAL